MIRNIFSGLNLPGTISLILILPFEAPTIKLPLEDCLPLPFPILILIFAQFFCLFVFSLIVTLVALGAVAPIK